MECYLEGREMRTEVEDMKSEQRNVDSGVPQGSELAPVLIPVYINDIPQKVNSCMSLSADDVNML